MTKLRLPIFALALLAVAGCASKPGATTAAAPRDCFNAASINNYAAQDSETVNLKVSANDYFQVKLLGVCPDIDWSQKIAFQTAGSAFVCAGNDITIGFQGPTGPQECAADTVRRLTAAEVAALPPRAKP